MDIFKKCYDYTVVKDYKAMGVYPYFHALDSKQGVEVMMEGKRRIMLGSNNYLGLTNDERVINAAVEATKQYGSGVSGSRFLNGTLTLHLELEQELANFLNKEACLTFSTGFQSNLGIISALAGRSDLIFCDRENHASIYDAARLSYAKMLRYRHNDMDELEKLLKEADPSKGKLIVTDGVFSMSGDVANLPKIVALAKQYNARVMVDDAHGFGAIGENGRGTAAYFGLEDQVDVVMGTFSKSLASLGGFMVGDATVVEYVQHKARPFIFSAALTPSNAAAALEALRVLKAEPERVTRLNAIASKMRSMLTKRGLPVVTDSEAPIVSVYTYGFLRTLLVCEMLYDRGVYVNPVLPPATPDNECLIRTSYTATHTEALIEEAADIIESVLNTLPKDEEKLIKMVQDRAG